MTIKDKLRGYQIWMECTNFKEQIKSHKERSKYTETGCTNSGRTEETSNALNNDCVTK